MKTQKMRIIKISPSPGSELLHVLRNLTTYKYISGAILVILPHLYSQPSLLQAVKGEVRPAILNTFLMLFFIVQILPTRQPQPLWWTPSRAV